MKIIYFSIAFCLTTLLIQGQVIIKGKLSDAVTSEAIPFANIYSKNLNYGTSSNAEGNFELKADSLPITLKISHIGYENKEVIVRSPADFGTVQLKPKAYVISEVVVQTAGGIIDKCLSVENKYDKSERTAKAFYRQLTKNGDDYTEIHEVFYDLSYSASGIKKYSIAQGRYGKLIGVKDSLNFSFKNFSYFSLGLRIFADKLGDVVIPLNKDYKKYYTFSFGDIRQSGKSSVAEIRFTPKVKGERPIFEGSIYIDMDTYLPLKMKGKIFHSMGAAFKNEILELKNFVYDIDMNFVLNDDNNLVLDYIKVNLQLDFFKLNQFIKHINVNSFLFAYEQGDEPVQKKLSKVSLKDIDLEKIKSVPYNKEFWENNPIVKRTPLEEAVMESFEKNNLFGNFF